MRELGFITKRQPLRTLARAERRRRIEEAEEARGRRIKEAHKYFSSHLLAAEDESWLHQSIKHAENLYKRDVCAAEKWFIKMMERI